METIDFFSTAQRVKGYQGDTFPLFRVPVTGMDLTGCSMRVVIEQNSVPGSIAYTKSCGHFENTETGEEGYSVQLDSPETARLSGVYTMHFILKDADDFEYRKLVVPLEVIPSPREVSN